MILKGYIFGIGYAFICLLISFVMYKLGLPKKYTRKIVHILVGFEWGILYRYFGAGIHFLTVCLIFLALLVIAYKCRLMPMIASDDDNSPGTVYYAVAMTGVSAVGCFVPAVMLPFGIGVMCTSFGDGLAGFIGQAVRRCNPKIYGRKTVLGVITNFVVSTACATVISSVYSLELGIAYCILIGILSTELELVTPYGLDNVSVTWGTTALAYAFIYFDKIDAYLIPILFTPLIVMLSIQKKALTKGGILAALLLDIAVTLAFGNKGFVVLCTFFVGSIIIDKIKKQYKIKSRNEKTERECRGYMQVLVNGMIAFLSSVSFIITENQIFVIPFVTSLGEAFADTVASGIGALSKRTYDPFRRQKCENGLSGGMSLIGTLSSFLAALIISVIAYCLAFNSLGFAELVIVTLCAFLGGIFDSFLGSLFQIKYRCTECGKITEREEHCDTQAVRYSGFAFIDNDIVNLLSCTFSAVLATILIIAL